MTMSNSDARKRLNERANTDTAPTETVSEDESKNDWSFTIEQEIGGPALATISRLGVPIFTGHNDVLCMTPQKISALLAAPTREQVLADAEQAWAKWGVTRSTGAEALAGQSGFIAGFLAGRGLDS